MAIATSNAIELVNTTETWNNLDDARRATNQAERAKAAIRIVEGLASAMSDPLFGAVNPILREVAGRVLDGTSPTSSPSQKAVDDIINRTERMRAELESIDFPGVTPANPTPTGMEWQPTIKSMANQWGQTRLILQKQADIIAIC